MASRRVHYDFFVHPRPFWVASDSFSCSICFGAVAFFSIWSSLQFPDSCAFPFRKYVLMLFCAMPAQILDTDAAFTRRSTVIGQEKTLGRMWLVRIGRVIVFSLQFLPILRIKQNLEIFGLYLELVTLRLPSWISASYGRCRSEFSYKSK